MDFIILTNRRNAESQWKNIYLTCIKTTGFTIKTDTIQKYSCLCSLLELVQMIFWETLLWDG